MKTGHAGEQVREEPLGVAQERAARFDAPQLLEEGQGDDLRVRELLERFVAAPPGVEQRVGVVYEAEECGHGLFQGSERGGMLLLGHPGLLWSGVGRMAFFLLPIHATRI